MGQKEQRQKFSSGENLRGRVEQIPSGSLHRNDPCVCGSNRKYKNCCFNKEPRCSSSFKLNLIPFIIKWDALTPEESQHDFPSITGEDGEVLSALSSTLVLHPETINSESCDFFRQLQFMRIKYPNNPIILNYLARGYQLLGQHERADALVDDVYEKFPKYLFAQIGIATKYLRENDPDKAIQVFKGSNTLWSLFPQRTVFHVSEVKAFECFMIQYFCEEVDVKQAESRLQSLEKILDEDDLDLEKAREMVILVKELCTGWGIVKMLGRLISKALRIPLNLFSRGQPHTVSPIS